MVDDIDEALERDGEAPSPEASPALMPEDVSASTKGTTLPSRAVAYVERLRADRERRAWVDVLLRVYERHREIGGSLFAGALGYRLFLLVLPLALVLASVLGFALASDVASAADAADEAGLPGLVTTALDDGATTIRDSRWWTGAVGIVVLLWATLTFLRALRTVNALAWRLPVKRLPHAPRATLVAVSVVLGLTALGGAVNTDAIAWVPWKALVNVGLLVTYGAFWLLLSAWLPHRGHALSDLLPGALVFAAGVKVLRLFLVVYVAPRFEHGSAIYGVFGMTTALLLALYVFGALIVVSPVLNAVLWERRQERESVVSADSPTDGGDVPGGASA